MGHAIGSSMIACALDLRGRRASANAEPGSSPVVSKWGSKPASARPRDLRRFETSLGPNQLKEFGQRIADQPFHRLG
jgi:hypothetical protein